MAEAAAGLELPIGLTEQKFMQQLARIESKAIKASSRMQQGFVKSNQEVTRSFGQMSNAARGNLQNVSYQLQDIFVQISSGTGAARALGQQLPQLLSGFGAMGAVLGLAASAAIPLAGALLGAGDAADEVAKKIDALQSSVKDYQDAAALAAAPTADLVAQYRGAAGAARELYVQLAFLAELKATENLESSLKTVGEQFGIVKDAVELINGEISLGLGDSGLVAGAMQTLRTEYGLTVDQARELVSLISALEGAQGVSAQAEAAQALSRFLSDAVRNGADIPASMREGAKATADAAISALQLQEATQASADAAANVAGQAGSIDFSNAIAGANALAAALAQASSAAAALSTHGVFAGGDGSIQTNRTGQRDPSTNWRFEDPAKDYDTLKERRAREAAEALRDEKQLARLLAGSGGGGGGGRKRAGRSGGGGSGAGKRPEPSLFERVERDAVQLQRQIELLGKTSEQVATLEARWALLDEAKKRGKPINAELTAQIDAQATNVGRLTAELERAELAQDQFDEAINTVADTMAGVLVGGESLRDSLANIFRGIASDIISSGIRNALTSQFGASGGGGFLSGVFGGGGGGFLSALFGGKPSFAGGGFTGAGPRSGGIDGQGGFPAILHPNETVIDHTRGQRSGMSYSPVFNIGGNVTPEDLAAVRREAAQGFQQMRREVPGIMDNHQKRRG